MAGVIQQDGRIVPNMKGYQYEPWRIIMIPMGCKGMTASDTPSECEATLTIERV